MICKYAEIFCWKNVSSFCSAKATHIFSAKNIRIIYIESAKTVNEMTLSELVKLTTLWTTGPVLQLKRLDFRDFVFSLFPKTIFFFLLLFYSTVTGVVPCGGVKSLPVHHHSADYILFPLGSLSPSWLFWKSNTAYAGARRRMHPRKLQYCVWWHSIKQSLWFSWFCVFFVPKGNPFWLLFILRYIWQNTMLTIMCWQSGLLEAHKEFALKLHVKFQIRLFQILWYIV